MGRKKMIALLVLGVLVVVPCAYLIRRGREIRRVAPQYRAALLWAPTQYLLQAWDIARLQRKVRKEAEQLPVAPQGTRITRKEIPSGKATISVYVYERQDRKPQSAAVLWIHGGGLVLGHATQDSDFLEAVVRELDVVLVSVEYHLAPEYPYPQPLNDCHAALVWLHDHAEELGVDTGRIAIGGDSAGGGLTAALVQRASDEGPVKPVFQALMYPMLDDRTTIKGNTARALEGVPGRGVFVWTPAQNLFGWTSYLGHAPTLAGERPYASAARRTDLSGLPPAWIGVGELDLFHNEDAEYCNRLRSAGVACQLDVVPTAYHGFNVVTPKAPGAIAFNQRMIAALGAGLGAIRQA